jgi:hypothetical protein
MWLPGGTLTSSIPVHTVSAIGHTTLRARSS